MDITSKEKIGICHLCGDYGKLSYEHVPPRSAYNKSKVLVAGGDKIFQGSFNLDEVKGIQLQRGLGGYTLCPKCNNNTGGWYGASYVMWVQQAYRYLKIAKSAPSIMLPYWIHPLRVIKQIVCMFFSANSNKFHKYHNELMNFVRYTRATGLDPKYRIYAFYNLSGRARMAGLVKRMDFSGTSQIYSEVAIPIVGYIMTVNSPPPDDELIDLTFMTKYHYNDLVEISMLIPRKDVYSFIPGDYRSRNQYMTDLGHNRFVHVDNPEKLE